MNEDEKKMLKNLGALGYPFDLVVKLICPPNRGEYLAKLNDQNSEEYQSYESGALYSQYTLDLKLFEMASSGDMKAMDKLNLRKIKLQNKNK